MQGPLGSARAYATMTDEPLPVVHPARRTPAPAVHQSAPWLFAAGMAVALGIAATAGTSLAILAVIDPASSPVNATALVQGHGRIQLLSFAAVFVLTLLFEFAVRFSGRSVLPGALRGLALSLVGGGALVIAAGQFSEGAADWLLVLGALLTLAGALLALAMVNRVRTTGSAPLEMSQLHFVAATSWLLVAALLALLGALSAINGLYQGADARAITEILLRGFILNAIIAVALRAIPGHLGVAPLRQSQKVAIFAGLNIAVATWVLGSGASVLPWSPVLMRAGDVALAFTLLLFTWWSRIPAACARPGSGYPIYQTLIPVAWLGAVAFAVALLGFSLTTGLVPGATPYQQGAVRHIFLLGFMVPLMLAFGHVVLARFGTGTFPGQRWLTGGFVIAVVAWPLRVVPPLFPDAPPDAVTHAIALSGVLFSLAFAIAAVVCGRTSYSIWRAHTSRPGTATSK